MRNNVSKFYDRVDETDLIRSSIKNDHSFIVIGSPRCVAGIVGAGFHALQDLQGGEDRVAHLPAEIDFEAPVFHGDRKQAGHCGGGTSLGINIQLVDHQLAFGLDIENPQPLTEFLI